MDIGQCLAAALQYFSHDPITEDRKLQYQVKGFGQNLHHVLERNLDKLEYHRQWLWWLGIRHMEVGYRPEDLHYMQTASQWSSSPVVWCSPALDVELALASPMPRQLQERVETMLLVPSVDCPPGLFLLTVYRGGGPVLGREMEEQTVQLARCCRKALSRLVPWRLPYILPLALAVQTAQDFTVDRLRTAVSQAWSHDVHSLASLHNHRRRWGAGPFSLSHRLLAVLRQAVPLLQCLSDVPTARAGQPSATYFMDPCFTAAVLAITQHLLAARHSRSLACDTQDQKVVFAIVEAARRLAYRGTIRIICSAHLFATICHLARSLGILEETDSAAPGRVIVRESTVEPTWQPAAVELHFALQAAHHATNEGSSLHFYHQ